jgi:hypothetical protein
LRSIQGIKITQPESGSCFAYEDNKELGSTSTVPFFMKQTVKLIGPIRRINHYSTICRNGARKRGSGYEFSGNIPAIAANGYLLQMPQG